MLSSRWIGLLFSLLNFDVGLAFFVQHLQEVKDDQTNPDRYVENHTKHH